MTKKHFIEIAETIRLNIQNAQADDAPALEALVHDLARDFKYFNSAFDKDRFLKACGIS